MKMCADMNGDSSVNDIAVLGTGATKSTIFERPKSGRRSSTPKTLQRSGSTLEILPNELSRNKTKKRDCHLSEFSNEESLRKTQSAGSNGFWSSTNCEENLLTKWKSSNTSLSSLPNKKVVLPSVKRNYQSLEMPNNDQSNAIGCSTALKDASSHLESKTNPNINSLESGIHGLHLLTKHTEHIADIPVAQVMKKTPVNQVANSSDDYYVTHSRSNDNCDSVSKIDSKKDGAWSLNQASVRPKEIISPLNKDSNSKDDSSEETDDEVEDERKAPIELLGEFLEAVMEEDFENAQKLCQMILIYEPRNKEANEFKPLIDEKLRKERERQLWGSSSSESSDEDSDTETDESDDEEEESNEEEGEKSSDEDST